MRVLNLDLAARIGFKMENINSEQKKQYEELRNSFHKERDEKKIKINEFTLTIEKAKQEVSKLENEINKSRPLIEDCDKHMLCKRCDIYSMKYLGSSPNPDKHHFYECVICGFGDKHT